MRILSVFLLMIAAACTTQLHTAYHPGDSAVQLWHDESIPLDPQWRHAGTARISVRGKIWNTDLLSPIDQAETQVFTRQNPEGLEILLIGRITKTNLTNTFLPLNGDKTSYEGNSYRTATYGLTSKQADPEFQRYLEMAQAGGNLASDYEVQVLDRLPLDTVLLRIIHLKPGINPNPLPSFAAMYPQEHEEMRITPRW